MIQQHVGDLLEVKVGRKYYYVVVLTKIALFGGNILFAFHNDGKKRKPEHLTPDQAGFNICADLLHPKRDGRVERLLTYDSVKGFWRTKHVKGTNTWQAGVKAEVWFINTMSRLGGSGLECRGELTQKQREAMDSGCHSFDVLD